MTFEELRSCVSDMLDITSLTDRQTTPELLSRINGASIEQVLAAALSVGRDQANEIKELRCTLEDAETERDGLANNIEALQDRIDKLRELIGEPTAK
jgi:predicted  nucleic acid-binding Zn-ribbon protein